MKFPALPQACSFAIVLLFSTPVFAQEAITYPALPHQARTAEEFAPSGWTVTKKAEGDLNGDNRADVVIFLQQQDPSLILTRPFLSGPFDTNPRILAVAFAQAGGGYTLSLENHTLLPPDALSGPNRRGYRQASGDIGITDGTWRIAFPGGGGPDSTEFTFRWQDGKFRLISYDQHQFLDGITYEISVNYLTGRMHRSQWEGRYGWQFAPANHENTVTVIPRGSDTNSRWTEFPVRPLLTLEQIGDWAAFSVSESTGLTIEPN